MLYFYLTYMHMVHFHVCVPRNIFLLYLALPRKAAAKSFSLQREISDEVKMLHNEFITVVIGPHSGKYLSMCLSPVEIVRT